jgi:hypothetical protein
VEAFEEAAACIQPSTIHCSEGKEVSNRMIPGHHQAPGMTLSDLGMVRPTFEVVASQVDVEEGLEATHSVALGAETSSERSMMMKYELRWLKC